jgi:hypothetical protein
MTEAAMRGFIFIGPTEIPKSKIIAAKRFMASSAKKLKKLDSELEVSSVDDVIDRWSKPNKAPGLCSCINHLCVMYNYPCQQAIINMLSFYADEAALHEVVDAWNNDWPTHLVRYPAELGMDGKKIVCAGGASYHDEPPASRSFGVFMRAELFGVLEVLGIE